MAKGKINVTLEQLEGLTPFLNPRYVTPQVLERIKRELPQKPVWHTSDFSLSNLEQPGYFGLNICLGCRRVYEICFKRDATLLDKPRVPGPGPYCTPCAREL